MKIHLVAGNICDFHGDAIVNAANNEGLGGGGVDGAIHKAAGPGLLEACKALPIIPGLQGLGRGMMPTDKVRIPTGGAIPTPAYSLPCKWVIHTAGPVWPQDEAAIEAARDTLIDCYVKPARLAHLLGLRSIAYPAISAGVYGCPPDVCAATALRCANMFETLGIQIDDVYFYLYPLIPNLGIWQHVAENLDIPIAEA